MYRLYVLVVPDSSSFRFLFDDYPKPSQGSNHHKRLHIDLAS